jgi:hypothetical protein
MKDTIVEAIDSVLHYLENHKDDAADRLFPNATDDSRKERLGMGILPFWNHLDLHNRKQLVLLAVNFYRPYKG